MIKTAITGLLAATLILPTSLIAQTQDPAQDAFDRAKAAYAKRGEGQIQTALQAIQEGLSVVQDATLKFDLLILGSRAYYYQADREVTDRDQRLATYQAGMDRALQARAVNNQFAESYYYFAINLGQWGQVKGISEVLGRRQELQQAIRDTMARETRESATAPVPGEKGGIRLDGHGAYRVLGRMFFKLPALAGGDKVRAIEFLRRTMDEKASPNVALNARYLAEALLDGEAPQRAEGRAILEVYARKSATDADMDQSRVPENTAELINIKKLLESLGG